MAAPKPCAEPGCPRSAAYLTRTKPAWCDEHITRILSDGALRPLEPFAGPTAWRLTECLTCGVKAHYRFVYTLEKNGLGEPTCRACYWRAWGKRTRALQGAYAATEAVPEEKARRHAEEHGYDYLGPLASPSLPDDPHNVRCRYCGRLSAQRLGDIGWGCQCQVNPRRAQDASTEARRSKKTLLKDTDLAAVDWWDQERNSSEAWATVTPRATRKVWWRCPECGERFESRVADMSSWPRCPRCDERQRAEWRAAYAQYKDTPVASVPELAAAWDDEADPNQIMVAGGWELRRFACPRGHHPRLSPLRYLQSGCPHCRGQRTTEERLAALEIDPDAFELNREIAAQWHPTRNGSLDVRHLSPTSRRPVWWLDASCGHEWQASPADREKRQRLRCPACRTILDSLAYHFPRLADEWSASNPLTAWQVRPSGTLPFTPVWTCSAQPGHAWTASLASRTSGSGCPMCRDAGKSSVELQHLEAARSVFGNASSGQPMRSPAFSSRAVWHPDITVDLSDGRTLVIEYDGAYWHASKSDVDLAKTLDLLAAETLVVRCREHPLAPLPLLDEHYLGLTVFATAPDAAAVMEQIALWCSEHTRTGRTLHPPPTPR